MGILGSQSVLAGITADKLASLTHDSSVPALDPLDLRIIKMLEDEPHLSFTDIAARLGISRATARSHLNGLVERGAARVICLPDHTALGYMSVVLAMNASPSNLLAVADKLASSPHILFVMLCAGRFNIISWGLFEGPGEYLEFISQDLATTPGLLQVEPLMLEEYLSFMPFLGVRPAFRPLGSRADSLDALDYAIMRELQTNARQTATGLAKALRTSKSTVLRRMQRLVDAQIIRIVTVVDPFALGFKGMGFIGMKVSPQNIQEAAEAIAKYPGVHSVSITMGRYDLVAWVAFQERRELIDLLKFELGQVPGLNNVEIITNLRIIKRKYSYLTREDGKRPRSKEHQVR